MESVEGETNLLDKNMFFKINIKFEKTQNIYVRWLYIEA